MRLFDRLIGLETEYAIAPPGSSGRGDAFPSRLRCYRLLVAALGRKLPVVEAQHFKVGVFAANSSAVWFEAERFSVDTGLIEGATPECRGPFEAVLYQRAQDRLLAASAAEAAVPGGFTLLKNDCDAQGNVYGAQENYEATLATGWRLVAWRIGLAALLLPAVIAWVGMFAVVLGTIGLFALLAATAWTARWIVGETRIERWLVNPRWLAANDIVSPLPEWLERVMLGLFNVAIAPVLAPLTLLIRWTAFVPQRRALEAFLVSRVAIAGAGWLDALEYAPDSLAGRLDWVAKLGLLEGMRGELSREARKKIDLRYHELSANGYHQRLAAAGLVETPGGQSWLNEAALERAMRTPPPDSPATMRGHFIREFADGEETLRVNWKRVTIGKGRDRRVIRLRRYRRAMKLDD